MSVNVAFYAPLKSPYHHIPSGDREIARLMMRALRLAGYKVDLISDVISYQKRPSPELYEKRRAAVGEEEQRIASLWQAQPASRPDLWFTYHPYCKSPDWLGPPLCQRFGIPYVTAEACRTHQGQDSDWSAGRAAVQSGVQMARANFVLKNTDWIYLKSFMPSMDTAVRIPPFLDLASQPEHPTHEDRVDFAVDRPLLLAAGMMRPGAKSESYWQLAKALTALGNRDWNLIIAGDGPERQVVESQFAFLAPDRVMFLGSVEHEKMFTLMDQADVFVWPGIGEAIGQVYLEAQSRGLPVVAMETAGVPLVVSDQVGGILTAEGDTDAYCRAIGQLLEEPDLLAKLSKTAPDYVRKNHDVEAVAATFRSVLGPIVQG
ncbi:MAG: glycosyltransferase family 4 protein [Alphaproteobacteria bacterium]|nr:glycosyltransferase family 4 protein [Alphaproteobacteria bacterium]